MSKSESPCPDGLIRVVVCLPSTPDPVRAEWREETLVGEAANRVAGSNGIDVRAPTFQTEADEVLDPNITLKAAGVECHDKLELVSFGGGV